VQAVTTSLPPGCGDFDCADTGEADPAAIRGAWIADASTEAARPAAASPGTPEADYDELDALRDRMWIAAHAMGSDRAEFNGLFESAVALAANQHEAFLNRHHGAALAARDAEVRVVAGGLTVIARAARVLGPTEAIKMGQVGQVVADVRRRIEAELAIARCDAEDAS
jgi:hypothetical protein